MTGDEVWKAGFKRMYLFVKYLCHSKVTEQTALLPKKVWHLARAGFGRRARKGYRTSRTGILQARRTAVVVEPITSVRMREWP